MGNKKHTTSFATLLQKSNVVCVKLGIAVHPTIKKKQKIEALQ